MHLALSPIVRCRRRRLCTNLALLVLLIASCAGCVSRAGSTFSVTSTSAAPAIPEGLGVNIHFTDPQPGELKTLSEAGFRWIRMDFKWDATELEKGKYDFASYDRLMTALDKFNLRALFILDYGNPLYDEGAPPRTEYSRQAFARWAVAAAKHFAGRGVIWETYNEPNNRGFWPPRVNVNEYAELALVVGKAFRASAPNEKLVGPAVGEMDFAFIEGCFRAGLLEYWSAVSVHPYLRSDPENVAGEYARLRNLITSYATAIKKDTPIFAGEWGYSSAWPGLNEEKQGALLAREFLTNTANGIALSIWYDWRDDGIDSKEAEHHFGLVGNRYYPNREPAYDPKPAYFAAKTLTNFFKSYRFEKRLSVGSDDDYVLLFRNGDNLRVAAWTISGGAHDVLLPLAAGQYAGVRHTGQSLPSLHADQNGLRISLSTAPMYLRRN